MSESHRQTPRISQEVIDAILARRDNLLVERAELRRQQQRLAMRDREIDRELADCQAAGRVFNVEVEVPRDDTEQARQQTFSDALWRIAIPRKTVELATAAATAAAKAAATKAEMPRIRDVVLDRLRVAGDQGSKASPIQHYIESTYEKGIHPKTVGMTLFRLAKEGLVRRDGHMWFITEKGMNPGAATPGLEDLLK